jgi:hypothetical protein
MGRSHDTPPKIPIEIEIYLNPDGSVTFADLEEHAVALARELDPDGPLACDVPAAGDSGPAQGQVTAE